MRRKLRAGPTLSFGKPARFTGDRQVAKVEDRASGALVRGVEGSMLRGASRAGRGVEIETGAIEDPKWVRFGDRSVKSNEGSR